MGADLNDLASDRIEPTDREKVPKAVFEIEQAILDASARIKWREVE